MVTLTRCPYPHPSHLQDSDGLPRPEGVHPPVFPALRQSRVVSSTSEEEEALTEKFLKINCKYITDGKVRCHVVTPINEYGHLFKITLHPPGRVTDRYLRTAVVKRMYCQQQITTLTSDQWIERNGFIGIKESN